MLKCPRGLVYVGQTKRALKSHISEHNTAIRTQNMDYAAARLYAKAKHSSAASLKFWGIEQISPSPRGGDIINSLLREEWGDVRRGILYSHSEHSGALWHKWRIEFVMFPLICHTWQMFVLVLFVLLSFLSDMVLGLWHLDTDYGNSHPLIHYPIDL